MFALVIMSFRKSSRCSAAVIGTSSVVVETIRQGGLLSECVYSVLGCECVLFLSLV